MSIRAAALALFQHAQFIQLVLNGTKMFSRSNETLDRIRAVEKALATLVDACSAPPATVADELELLRDHRDRLTDQLSHLRWAAKCVESVWDKGVSGREFAKHLNRLSEVLREIDQRTP